MSLSMEELVERREIAAQRLGRARQAFDRNPDNTRLEKNFDEAEKIYLRADSAVLAAEKNRLLYGRKNRDV